MARNKRPDLLQVQVAINIRAPRGVRIHPQVNQQILDRLASGGKLPPNVEVRGIFWRNPNRRGELSYWRYHEGIDLDKVKGVTTDLAGNHYIDGTRLEDSPRGSLQDAVDSLSGALLSGTVTF
jgi:hypothetical protein